MSRNDENWRARAHRLTRGDGESLKRCDTNECKYASPKKAISVAALMRKCMALCARRRDTIV